MARNRFQLLLRFVHFADNESLQDSEDSKLHKVRMLVQMLVRIPIPIIVHMVVDIVMQQLKQNILMDVMAVV